MELANEHLNPKSAMCREDTSLPIGGQNKPNTTGHPSLHHYKFVFPLHQLAERLKDVRFVLVAGCRRRTEALAAYLADHLSSQDRKLNSELIVDSCSRLTLFKVGPVLVGDHGMGSPSLLIALHEICLMCKAAGVLSQIVLIRFGTCGGIGIKPGTVCITNKAMDSHFNEFVELKVCQKLVKRRCVIDSDMCQSLLQVATQYQHQDQLGPYEIRTGATIATNDYYEEQARISGAICEHSQEDERRFLEEASKRGVINIEMESNHLAAFCHKLQLPAAVVCVSLNNRFEAAHLELTTTHQAVYQQRLFLILLQFVRHSMDTK